MSRESGKTKAKTAASRRSRRLDRKLLKQKERKAAAKRPPIPGSVELTKQTILTIRRFYKPLGGILIVYVLVNVFFASQVPSDLSSTLATVKQNLNSSHDFSKALSGFGSLLGGSSGASQGGSVMPSVLLVFESLVIIWALRQLLAGKKISVKQAYYRSMTPLVPFLLVIAFIFVQLLPVTLGGAAFSLISDSAAGSTLITIFLVLFVALAAWSIYMVSGTLFAMYIVTLPGVEPWSAIRSAKGIVEHRRWPLLRRLLFLPVGLLLVLGVITVPLILVAQPLVVPIFYVMIMTSVIFVHTYLYSLYRSLVA